MAALSRPGNRCIRVARQSGLQEKCWSPGEENIDESGLCSETALVKRRARKGASQLETALEKGASQLESCLRACRALLCAVELLLKVH